MSKCPNTSHWNALSFLITSSLPLKLQNKLSKSSLIILSSIIPLFKFISKGQIYCSSKEVIFGLVYGASAVATWFCHNIVNLPVEPTVQGLSAVCYVATYSNLLRYTALKLGN